MDSPRQDIFLNHDIFLAILCQLDLKDLLVVRRVRGKRLFEIRSVADLSFLSVGLQGFAGFDS